ncbi:hypothetical protein [Haloarchaeobius iranensis]|uniref:Uncharacterized protein n=1 Tax=Haloarchaeobius iranensis TaxID=996166 RepID=A0A1H0A864_9EURY|nr:hypothetical protein [Haloarchaeobius iranensis]SDN29665.1 hypothetical protein SAMN05192554_12534 [Haloarchaeobius iranensis]
MVDGEKSDTSRRAILKGTAGTVGAASIPATAAANSSGQSIELRRKRLEAQRRIPKEYDEASVQEALDEDAEALLRALADEGFISSPDLSDFASIEDPASSATMSNNRKVATVGDVHEATGQQTAHLQAYATTDSHDIDFHVLPDVDVAFAVAKERSGDGLFLVDPSNDTTTSEVSPQGCSGEKCQAICDPTNPRIDPYVIRTQGDTPCSNTCVDSEDICGECPDADECDDSGGGGW